MNGKFVEKYGQTWKDMDSDTRQAALMSEIFDLREDMAPLKESCEKTSRHDLYFKIIWVIMIFVFFPVLVALIVRSFT